MHKKVQDTLSLRHYFRVQPLKCTILSGDINNFFTLKTEDALEFNNHVIKGDPVIFGTLLENNEIKVTGGNILSINENDMHLIISPDKTFNIPEKREYERFPVSVLGYLKSYKDTHKGAYIYVKDMSYSGFRVYSTAELAIEETVQIDLYMQDTVLNVDGIVIRKAISFSRNEYGIQILYRDRSSMYSIRNYLDKLVISEKHLLMKHLIK